MNGGGGFLRRSLRSTPETFSDALLMMSTTSRAPPSLVSSAFLPSSLATLAVNGGGVCPSTCASTDQYSSGLKGGDLLLALDDQPHGDRLHAPRRQPAPHLGPEHRADLVADQAVQHAARLLRLELLHVELHRLADRLVDRLLGDLVEEDALDVRVRRAHLLGDVPGDRLPFAIGVGRQQHALRVPRGLHDLRQHLLLAVDDHVLGLEAVLDVDPHLLLGEILHVADRRLHRCSPAPRYFLIVFALAGDSTITSASLVRRARVGRAAATSLGLRRPPPSGPSPCAPEPPLRLRRGHLGLRRHLGGRPLAVVVAGLGLGGLGLRGGSARAVAGVSVVSTAVAFFLVGTSDLCGCKDAARPPSGSIRRAQPQTKSPAPPAAAAPAGAPPRPRSRRPPAPSINGRSAAGTDEAAGTASPASAASSSAPSRTGRARPVAMSPSVPGAARNGAAAAAPSEAPAAR